MLLVSFPSEMRTTAFFRLRPLCFGHRPDDGVVHRGAANRVNATQTLAHRVMVVVHS